MLIVVGASPADLLRYSGYLLWSLVIPGTLVYRVAWRARHSLVDDLAMGVVVGLALEVAAWAAFGAMGAQRMLWLWPLAVVVPFAAVPKLRRHWLMPVGYRHQPSPGWSWVAAGIVVCAVGYLVVGPLWHNPPLPTGAGAWYHRDNVYLLALVGEAKLHFPMTASTVAGEPLPYHIFAYTHTASASLVSGVDSAVVAFQLDLAFVIAMPAILLAVVGWRISGKPWIGALSAALMFVVGEFTHEFLSANGIGTTFAYYSYSSPSQTVAWSFAFALLGVLTPVLTRDEFPRQGMPGRAGWLLLAMLAAAAAGTKATVLPVLLAGLGLAGLVELVRRRRVGRDLLLTAGILLGVQLAAMAVLFRFQGGGLSFAPFYLVPRRDRWGEQLTTFVLAGIAFAVYMFARLAGIPVLARLTGRTWARREYFLLGAVLFGWACAVLLAHPGLGQNFFLATAFGFGAILSAMGFAALIVRHRLPAGIVALVVIGVAVAAIEIDGRLARPVLPVLDGWYLPGDGAIIHYGILFGAVGAVVGLIWLLVVRRHVRRGVGATVALGAVMLAGLPTLLNDAGSVRRTHFWHVFVSSDQVASARWLRDHSSPDDLVATNEHCVDGGSTSGAGCLSLSYWLAGYSERRLLVGSWSYTPRITDAGGGNAFTVPFWDQKLLRDNDIVFSDPTAERVAELRVHRRVRWLVANRAVARESADLARFASPRLRRGDIAIYELV